MNNNNTTNSLFSTLVPVLEVRDLHLTDFFRSLVRALKEVTGIYCVRNTVTGAMYIGSAVDLGKRFAEHFLYGKTNEHLQRALN